MAITENLKKILAAVYGRDVRQSIHDSIQECYNNAEACKSYTNEHVKDMETKMAGITGQSKALMAKTRKDVRNVQAIFSVEKTVSITDGKLWEAQDAGSSCVLMEGAKNTVYNTECTTRRTVYHTYEHGHHEPVVDAENIRLFLQLITAVPDSQWFQL